jgi:hypothetical protein
LNNFVITNLKQNNNRKTSSIATNRRDTFALLRSITTFQIILVLGEKATTLQRRKWQSKVARIFCRKTFFLIFEIFQVHYCSCGQKCHWKENKEKTFETKSFFSFQEISLVQKSGLLSLIIYTLSLQI